MKLKCPHGLQVEIRDTFGITCYYHKDQGEPCSIMNSFTVGIDEVLFEMSKNVDMKSSVYLIALRNSEKVEEDLFQKMSGEKDVDRLVDYHKLLDKAHEITRYAMMEFGSYDAGTPASRPSVRVLNALGQTFFRNLSIITGETDVKSLGQSINSYYNGVKPKYTLMKLDRYYTDAGLGYIKDTLEKKRRAAQARQRRKQFGDAYSEVKTPGRR